MFSFLVTEIDENTAIEYIEEDGVVIIPNLTTGSTTPATTTSVTVVSNSMEIEQLGGKETVATTNAGSDKKDSGVSKAANKQSVNSSSSCINHLETFAGNKSKNDRKKSETILGSLTQQPQQHQETMANNSGTQVEL